jgi:hypothetical protein
MTESVWFDLSNKSTALPFLRSPRQLITDRQWFHPLQDVAPNVTVNIKPAGESDAIMMESMDVKDGINNKYSLAVPMSREKARSSSFPKLPSSMVVPASNGDDSADSLADYHFDQQIAMLSIQLSSLVFKANHSQICCQTSILVLQL